MEVRSQEKEARIGTENRSVQAVWLDERHARKLKTQKQSRYVYENTGQVLEICISCCTNPDRQLPGIVGSGF